MHRVLNPDWILFRFNVNEEALDLVVRNPMELIYSLFTLMNNSAHMVIKIDKGKSDSLISIEA